MRALPLALALVAIGCGDKDQPVDSDEPAVDADGDGYDSLDDCDDDDPEINPGADERCDAVDWNCDGVPTLGAADAPTWTLDGDGDGYGGMGAATTQACEQPDGFVDNDLDCDDRDADVNPAATEVCDREDVDEDCDGLSDDADDSVDPSTTVSLVPDADGDGYGEAGAAATQGCDVGGGLADNDLDCDDGDAAISPDATEICGDGVDQDCDGTSNTCGPNGELDLGAYVHVTGATGDQLGVSLAGGVDLTGDGAIDLVMGLSQAANGGAGAVRVYSGGLGGTPATLTGSVPGQRVGATVAAGFEDGDGVGDLVVGAPNHANGSGWAALVRGPVSGGALATRASVSELGGAGSELTGGGALVASLSGGGAWAFGQPGLDRVILVQGGVDHTLAGDGVGTALARADFDGDGFDAVVLGAADDGAGRVYVLDDPTAAPTINLSQDAARITGAGDGHRFGEAVAQGHDADGDGADDLLTSAPDADGNTGVAYLFLGEPSASATAADADATITAFNAGDRLGRALAMADVDGDGVADLVIGAPGLDVSGTDLGAALLFYGPVQGALTPADADATLAGESDFAGAGSALAGVGDVDGDGYEDLLVGAPGEASLAGAVYLVTGGGL